MRWLSRGRHGWTRWRILVDELRGVARIRQWLAVLSARNFLARSQSFGEQGSGLRHLLDMGFEMSTSPFLLHHSSTGGAHPLHA